MTHSLRIRLADQYLKCLDEGRTEDLAPILAAAETDPGLADMIIALSRGFSEEDGRTLAPAERARIDGQLAEIAARAPSDVRTVPEPSSSQRDGLAHGRTFLVLLKEETGKSMTEASSDLDATANFFDDLNSYPAHPDPRVTALRLVAFDRTEAAHGIPAAVSEDAMGNNPLDSLAAYAEGEIDHSVPTFEEILEDSGMTPGQQARWRDEAERLVREGRVGV